MREQYHLPTCSKPDGTCLCPPVRGMTKIPDFYNTPQWEVLFGGFWFSLCEYLIGQEKARDAFEKDTGMRISSLLNRSPFDAAIDKATGYQDSLMASWCDWVTVNHWGEQK